MKGNSGTWEHEKTDPQSLRGQDPQEWSEY
jgi:hypothetical protein